MYLAQFGHAEKRPVYAKECGSAFVDCFIIRRVVFFFRWNRRECVFIYVCMQCSYPDQEMALYDPKESHLSLDVNHLLTLFFQR